MKRKKINETQPIQIKQEENRKIKIHKVSLINLKSQQENNDEAKFEKYYKKLYKSNFNEGSLSLKKKISGSNYSKSYENFASKRIIIDEQHKIKCFNCSQCNISDCDHINSEEIKPKKSNFNSTTTATLNYCKTIVKNNNIIINPFQKKTPFNLKMKKIEKNETANNVYQKIKKDWVEEFFWKKYNEETPLKNQKDFKDIVMNDACKPEVSDDLKLYKTFNSQFMRKIYFLSPFKKYFDRISQTIEGNNHNEEDTNNEKLKQCLGVFSDYIFDEHLEVKLKNFNYESEIFKKILFFQNFLIENLMKNKQEDLAKMTDIIFKMMSLLYEKAH